MYYLFVCLFILSLFNDAITISDYIASDLGQTINNEAAVWHEGLK
jgi:hypothetical protein